MGSAIFLTFITTYLGFLSVYLNKIELLQQFGLVASGGLALNFFITVMVVPVCLRFVGKDTRPSANIPRSTLFPRVVNRILTFLELRKFSVLAMIGVIVAISAIGIPRLNVDNDPLSQLGEDSEVGRRVHMLHERLAGHKILYRHQ